MCANCIRTRVDITEGIPKSVALQVQSHSRFAFLGSGFGFRVLGFGILVSDFGFRVSGFPGCPQERCSLGPSPFSLSEKSVTLQLERGFQCLILGFGLSSYSCFVFRISCFRFRVGGLCLSRAPWSDVRQLHWDAGGHGRGHPQELISHKVFLKSFCRDQPPHQSVSSSFAVTNIKNMLTASCGN